MRFKLDENLGVRGPMRFDRLPVRATRNQLTPSNLTRSANSRPSESVTNAVLNCSSRRNGIELFSPACSSMHLIQGALSTRI